MINYTHKTIAGIDTIIAQMQEANSVTIEIFVKAGSIYEERHTNGISHFLEHMFFKGGKKFPTPHSVAAHVDAFGGEFNAYTSDEYAGYYVKCAPEYLGQAVDVLGDMLVDAQFPEEELEREKNVVIQEIKMYEDMPQRQVFTKRQQFFFGDNSYGRSILGPEDNIKQFNRDMLFEHKDSLYTKDNLVIVVGGNIINQDQLEQQIADAFGRLPTHARKQKPAYKRYLPPQQRDFMDKKTEQNHLIISAYGFRMDDDTKYAASLLATILGGNMSSRLFQNIREKQGLCYYISGGHSTDTDEGTFIIRAGIDKERFIFGVDAIFNEIKKLVDDGITEEEYQKALGYRKGSIQMGIESSDSMTSFIGEQYLLTGKIKTLEDILQAYQKVTIDEINQIKNMLSDDKLYMYHIQ